MADPINGRRIIAGTVGGALLGRFVADLVGAPPWVGGVVGAAAPIVRATGADAALPLQVRAGIRLLALPGESIGRAMYPQTLVLQAPDLEPDE
jgi:hypothetical protein